MKLLNQIEQLSEGVLGSDEREENTYPDGKFNYEDWKNGKGPVRQPERRVSKPDPSRWDDIDVDRRKKKDEPK